MAEFHSVTVTGLRKTIRTAVEVTLQPDDPQAFAFLPGQYLTFRHAFDGQELRRTYSICAGADDGVLQVGIKQVEGGAFSTWANEALKVGDRLDALPPMGAFHVSPGGAARHYLAFAGGSGITPILSILRSVLSREPGSVFTLVYANRAVSTIMFREELEDLKNRHMGRLNIIHVLENDTHEIELFSGRIDAAKCNELLRRWIPVETVDLALICGPEPMMQAVRAGLADAGFPPERVKVELFASARQGRLPQRVVSAQAAQPRDGAAATAIIGGESRSFRVLPGQTLLQAARAQDIDAPFACTAGVCSTCRAKVLEGEVEMASNHALEDYEVERGYVLTCQSYVLSDRVVFDYDQ